MLVYLKKTQPHLYTNINCPMCDCKSEDWLHIYLCPTQMTHIKECVELSIKYMVISLTDHIIDYDSFVKDLFGLSI